MGHRVLQCFHKYVITVILTLFCLTSFSAPTERLVNKPEVQKFINSMATKYKYNPAYIRHILNQAKYRADIVENMEAPMEVEPWYKYQAFFITPERVQDGIKFYDSYNKVLKLAENYFGVPGPIIAAILGIETRWGKETGRYRVIDALVTLSFYYPPRATFFQGELRDFFLLVKEKRLNPLSMYGSYAGAMGMPQFMPSSYLYYGYGFPNERKVDLFHSKQDSIFSVGNFLMQKGWERNQPIAVRARVVGSRYEEILKKESQKSYAPTLTLHDLAKYGVTPDSDKYFSPHLTAYLIKLEGKNGPEYWLGFHNFYVITRYNNSDLYALTAYQLGNAVLKGWQEYKIQKQKSIQTN